MNKKDLKLINKFFNVVIDKITDETLKDYKDYITVKPKLLKQFNCECKKWGNNFNLDDENISNVLEEFRETASDKNEVKLYKYIVNQLYQKKAGK